MRMRRRKRGRGRRYKGNELGGRICGFDTKIVIKIF